LEPLARTLLAKVHEAGLQCAAEIECRCQPAMVWLARSGVRLDVQAWQALARVAWQEAGPLAQELDELAPPRPAARKGRPQRWSWGSPKQIQTLFGQLGVAVGSTREEVLAALQHPLAELLLRYRRAQKLANTYGTRWLDAVAADGRVYAAWRQLGAESG